MTDFLSKRYIRSWWVIFPWVLTLKLFN